MTARRLSPQQDTHHQRPRCQQRRACSRADPVRTEETQGGAAPSLPSERGGRIDTRTRTRTRTRCGVSRVLDRTSPPAGVSRRGERIERVQKKRSPPRETKKREGEELEGGRARRRHFDGPAGADSKSAGGALSVGCSCCPQRGAATPRRLAAEAGRGDAAKRGRQFSAPWSASAARRVGTSRKIGRALRRVDNTVAA